MVGQRRRERGVADTSHHGQRGDGHERLTPFAGSVEAPQRDQAADGGDGEYAATDGDDRGEGAEPADEPRARARPVHAHQPDREPGEEDEEIEAGLKTRQGVLERERRRECEPDRQRHERQRAPSSREPQDDGKNHRHHRVQGGIDDDLELRIPLAVHRHEGHGEHAREEDAVLVVEREHLMPRQTAVGERQVKARGLAVPLIPERDRHGVVLDEQELRPERDEKERSQPARVPHADRTAEDVPGEKAERRRNQAEAGERDPGERERRHELHAAPRRRGGQPHALHEQHRIVRVLGRDDADILTSRHDAFDLVQRGKEDRVDGADDFPVTVHDPHAADQHFPRTVQRIEPDEE